MSDWGIKVALPGVDVATATPDQCSLHSSYASPKIKKNQSPTHRGILELILNSTYANGETTVDSFSHGYTYSPMLWAVVNRQDLSTNLFGFQPFVSGTLSVEMRAGTANIVTVVNNQSGGALSFSADLKFSYGIFAESGA